ncbi:transcription elongation factor GreA domain-containing protein [Chlamydia trachomatis]|nr:transcription elongation factor GreA domain-containing protein [Chlamydia trachomatis]
MDYIYMTEEGYQNLLEEIRKLEEVERPEVIQAIAEARDKGDLSENAEYSAAKEKQALLEDRIAQLRVQLQNIRIIDTKKIGTETVQMLNTVTIRNMSNNQVKTYTIVSDTESDIRKGKMAISTPIAKGLIGKKVGDVVEIDVPAGKVTFKIEEITI